MKFKICWTISQHRLLVIGLAIAMAKHIGNGKNQYAFKFGMLPVKKDVSNHNKIYRLFAKIFQEIIFKNMKLTTFLI